MPENDLVPPDHLIFDGAASGEEFKRIGEGFTRYFLIEHARLQPHERVLDVGSGIGQKARALTKYLDGRGVYDGFDIVEEGIEWCRNHYQGYPNFRFLHANINDAYFNPRGELPVTEYTFPYARATFDVVFLSSVFTHMLPDGMKHYMSEIARVGKPGGRCVMTFFLLNPESIKRLEAGSSSIPFPYLYQSKECRIMEREVPEKAVAHDEALVRLLHERNGLSITEITYGNWCGRKEIVGSLQDVIISVKE